VVAAIPLALDGCYGEQADGERGSDQGEREHRRIVAARPPGVKKRDVGTTT
jgi:hypothetical protein